MNRALMMIIYIIIGIALLLVVYVIIKGLFNKGTDLFVTKGQIQDNLKDMASKGYSICSQKNLEFGGVYMTDIDKGYTLCLMKSPCKIIQEVVSLE